MGNNRRSKPDSLPTSGHILRTVQSKGQTDPESLRYKRVFCREATPAGDYTGLCAKLESVTAVSRGKMTVGDAAEAYLEKVRNSVSLKPRSKTFREMIIGFIYRSWPTLRHMDARRLSKRDCQLWLAKFQKHYAPSVVNNAIGTLRGVFAEAVDSGARFGNPAANLARMRVRSKRLELPSREEFLRFVEEIRTAGARPSKDCANLVRFLLTAQFGLARQSSSPRQMRILIVTSCTSAVTRSLPRKMGRQVTFQ